MVLVRLGGNRRLKKIVWERYVVSVIVLESENGNKGMGPASEESKAKEKV